MELIEMFDGKTVFFDTAPFIYVFENKLPYKKLLAPVFRAVDTGTIHAVSSLITVIEVLSKPYSIEQFDLVRTYREVFGSSSKIDVLPLTLELADLTAQIRGQYNLKTPDAIQWATATLHKVDYFLTNDKRYNVLNDDRVLIVDEYVLKR
jgi:predicted nucleic acid-binding protein